jgi:ribosome maturation factor RimP
MGVSAPIVFRDMPDIQQLTGAAIQELGDGDLFLVDVTELPEDGFEVIIDSDGRVSVDDCVRLTKAIEGRFDRETDDFSLTVMSAGIGQPLKILRQYTKLFGRQVDVTLKTGKKFTAVLQGADNESITVNDERIELHDIKSTKEHINFK